jgi:chromosomal replication initiation ATPase DnaA
MPAQAGRHKERSLTMPEDIVLEILKNIQADIADLKRAVANLPAMRRDIAVLTQDGRMIRAALNDLARHA